MVLIAVLHAYRGPVLERASKAAWELILSKEGVGTEISETVYRAYNQLHGKDESHYSPPDPHTPIMANAHEMQSHGYGVGQPNGQMQELCQTPLTAPKVRNNKESPFTKDNMFGSLTLLWIFHAGHTNTTLIMIWDLVLLQGVFHDFHRKNVT